MTIQELRKEVEKRFEEAKEVGSRLKNSSNRDYWAGKVCAYHEVILLLEDNNG